MDVAAAQAQLERNKYNMADSPFIIDGSRITVISKVDRGTRFEFELPLCEQAA